MLRVIINADDFGKDHEVNFAIEEQIINSNITSTTIMANADGFDEAIQFAMHHPNVSYGVHLSLDEYAPVTTQRAFVDKGIVDAETGLFVKGSLWHAAIDVELKEAVTAEWNAQINKIKEAGITPSHIDSHHHVHTIPALKGVLLDVAKRNDITKVRGCDYVTFHKYLHGWQHFQNSNRVKELAYFMLRYSRFNEKKRWMVDVRRSIKMTDDFCSVVAYFRNKTYFDYYYHDKVVELECHPGHEKYAEETKMLEQIRNVQKITYFDL